MYIVLPSHKGSFTVQQLITNSHKQTKARFNQRNVRHHGTLL